MPEYIFKNIHVTECLYQQISKTKVLLGVIRYRQYQTIEEILFWIKEETFCLFVCFFVKVSWATFHSPLLQCIQYYYQTHEWELIHFNCCTKSPVNGISRHLQYFQNSMGKKFIILVTCIKEYSSSCGACKHLHNKSENVVQAVVICM